MPAISPMSTTVEVAVVDDARIATILMQWATRAAYPEPVLRNMVEFRQHQNERQFDSEGSYGGDPWERLQEDTSRIKARAGQDPRILQASLRLRESLTGETGDTVIHIDPRGFSMGTNVPYAGVVSEGSDQENIPARPIFVERIDTLAVMTEMLKTWIVGRSILNKLKRGEL
jgi:phage gpG-like protein